MPIATENDIDSLIETAAPDASGGAPNREVGPIRKNDVPLVTIETTPPAEGRSGREEVDDRQQQRPAPRRGREQPQEVEDDDETRGGRPDPVADAVRELAETNRLTRESLEKASKPAPKQYTPEEIDQMWAVYKPSAAFLRELIEPLPADATPEQVEKRMKMFSEYQTGILRQAVQAARNIMTDEFSKRDTRLDEFQAFRDEAAKRQVRQDFNGRYPVFKDTKYDRILKAVALEMKNETFTSNEKYFDALAERAAEAIREYIEDFDLDEPETKPTRNNSGGRPRVPRSGGGGGGGHPGREGRPNRQQPESTVGRNDIGSLY